MAKVGEAWYAFPWSDEALDTIYELNYHHMIILWVDLLWDNPDMTDKEIDDYFVNEREDIVRRLGYQSWQEIEDEDWCFRPEGTIWEILEEWELHGRKQIRR